jgi:hypothetical protein
MSETLTDWMWGSLGIMVDAYEGATTMLSNAPSALWQGTKKLGMTLVESGGGSAMYLANLGIRGVGYTALGTGALATTGLGMMGVTATAVTGSLVGGALAGVPGGVIGGMVGATEGLELLESSAEVAGDILSLGGEVGRMTFVGRLPNSPGFDDALNEKAEDIGRLFDAARQAARKGGNIDKALNALDDALTDMTATQGGKEAELDLEKFHTALGLGGHFVKQDGGELYRFFAGMKKPEKQKAQSEGDSGEKEADGKDEKEAQDGGEESFMTARTSSHYSGQAAAQFGMDLPGGLGHLLVGLTNEGDTFFQLESHGLGSSAHTLYETACEKLGHTLAYLQHIGGSSSYVQIGPGGCIAASEKDGQQVVLRKKQN